jgi:hypothetical protein
MHHACHDAAQYRWVKAPTSAELTRLAHTIAHRVGPQAGRKVFRLQTLPACDEPFDDDGGGKVAGSVCMSG